MAQKTQGAALKVATANGSSKTITAATAANPVVVTSAGHALSNGTVVYIDGIVGMTQLNKRAFVIANVATNTFELKGEDGSAHTAYASGGTALPKTMTNVGECRGIGPGFDGEASEIDVTHLLSQAKEVIMGLQDFGQVPCTMFITSPEDTGQARMRKLKRQAASDVFTIEMASGQIAAFVAFVKSFPFSEINPDNAFSGSPVLRVTNEPAWFA